MKLNVGSLDRILRVVAGAALIGYGYYIGNPWFYLGAIPLITGLVGFCPAYSLVGMSTRKA